jgi:hypothetical protein
VKKEDIKGRETLFSKRVSLPLTLTIIYPYEFFGKLKDFFCTRYVDRNQVIRKLFYINDEDFKEIKKIRNLYL